MTNLNIYYFLKYRYYPFQTESCQFFFEEDFSWNFNKKIQFLLENRKYCLESTISYVINEANNQNMKKLG